MQMIEKKNLTTNPINLYNKVQQDKTENTTEVEANISISRVSDLQTDLHMALQTNGWT